MAESSFKIKAGLPTIDKDPNATLDYTLDLSAWLNDIEDRVTSHTMAAVGVTVESSTIVDGNKIVAWVSGGTIGSAASITFHFTTTNGRTDDRTFAFNIKQR